MTPTNRYDVAVVGLGGIGSMAAWRAAARGAKTIGIEQFGAAHSKGSSFGGSRIFRQTLFEGTQYVPLVNHALPLWRELERRSGATLFTRSGGLCIGPRENGVVSRALDLARASGFQHRLLEPDELAHLYPQHATIADDVAVFEPGAGILNPEKSVTAALDVAHAEGAELWFDTPVTAVEYSDGGVCIDVAGERVHARRAIIATGAWFTQLIPGLRLPLRVQRSPLVWFKGRDQAAYRPDRFPVFIRKTGELDGWGISDVDGVGVKVGVGPSVPKPFIDRPEDNDYPIDAPDTDPAEAFCRQAFPGLIPTASAARACMNSRTPDRDFVIGISRRAPSLVLAGGYSGHGFKYATASGDVAVDLALAGESTIPLDQFSPDRFEDA